MNDKVSINVNNVMIFSLNKVIRSKLPKKHYSGDMKSDRLQSGLFEGRISNGRALAMTIAIVPTIYMDLMTDQ